MKVVGLGAGLTDPATRFRILSHLQLFQDKGHEAYFQSFSLPKFGIPDSGVNAFLKPTHIPLLYYWDFFRLIEKMPILWSYLTNDIIFLNRMLIPCHITYERLIYSKLVFDFDDAIWLGEGKGKMPEIMENSKLVFAGNQYLLDYAKQYNGHSSHLIPTPVDTKLYAPIQHRSDQFIVGWIGTSSNFHFLERVYPFVVAFLKSYPQVEFRIMSNESPTFIQGESANVTFQYWTKEKEIPFIQALTVGLMPLQNDEWSKGKCSYKMLQYMSCGVPVLVSPFGMNQELLDKGEIGLGIEKYVDWYDALVYMYQNKGDKLRNMGAAGRRIVEEEFDLDMINDKILTLLTT